MKSGKIFSSFRGAGLLALAAFMAGGSASAVTSGPSPQNAMSPAQHDFVGACLHAFSQSGGKPDPAISHQICECTARESKHQGVKEPSLKHETVEIAKDPKYEIKDEALMNSFRYCAIELMRHLTHDE